MNKKIISLIVLFVFGCFNFSCYTTRMINLAKGESWDQSGKILTVYTKSGDLIKFSKKVKIVQDKIVGTIIEKTGEEKSVSIQISDVQVVWVKAGSGDIFLVPFAVFGIGFPILVMIALHNM